MTSQISTQNEKSPGENPVLEKVQILVLNFSDATWQELAETLMDETWQSPLAWEDVMSEEYMGWV